MVNWVSEKRDSTLPGKQVLMRLLKQYYVRVANGIGTRSLEITNQICETAGVPWSLRFCSMLSRTIESEQSMIFSM